ncbi:hypothetical protein [Bifidobacterium saguinibicoloris]|uniref:hypothetical protein n=1 Tax=Bifidobacterium saguinibicoloris TaxID=2834433 RepID=UPI001C56DE51|nr:hypothetical protein [Bifidobacterium saguinibicoloris]MBW3080236.1 hypothetical protein [Bifidobacterium saguinibicoloris]
MHDDTKDRPRYGHMLGGHLTLDAIVSFPISLLAAWLGLRFIAHAAFDAGELAASLAITWLGVSLIDSRLDYELRRATNRAAPPMPWPMVAVKMALPFALPWLALLATVWHADMATVAAASVAAGAIRLAEIIGLERPWRGEDQETVDRRRRELQRITRETAEEIREERQSRTDAYDPYNLRGKR